MPNCASSTIAGEIWALDSQENHYRYILGTICALSLPQTLRKPFSSSKRTIVL